MSDTGSSRLERLLRLAELNRGPLAAEQEASHVAQELRRRRQGRGGERAHPDPLRALYGRTPSPRHLGHSPATTPTTYGHDAGGPLRGEEVRHPVHGPAFSVGMCDDVLARLASSQTERLHTIRSLFSSAGAQPDVEDDAETGADVAFLDIETGGLGDAIVFLVGMLHLSRDGVGLTQYLARDYSEEAAVAALSMDLLARCRLLVTFNGKSFDMPMLRARAARYRIATSEPAEHIDLLHVCRRAWRGEMPNFRLQTLESRICGRWRTDDIPGAEVPDVYHAYVRTGCTDDMARVLRHNAHDLATLAELALHLPD